MCEDPEARFLIDDIDNRGREYHVKNGKIFFNENDKPDGSSVAFWCSKDWTQIKPKKRLWRRAVKISDGGWVIETNWYPSKEEFSLRYFGHSGYGKWQSIEEPESCEEE